MIGVLENPRVVKRTSACAHAVAAGDVHHVPGRFRRGNISVADYRDTLRRLDHLADAREDHHPGEPLFACPPMNENRCGADTLEHAYPVGRGDVFVVPAETHFGRDRQLHRIDHRLHEVRGLVQLGHHR